MISAHTFFVSVGVFIIFNPIYEPYLFWFFVVLVLGNHFIVKQFLTDSIQSQGASLRDSLDKS